MKPELQEDLVGGNHFPSSAFEPMTEIRACRFDCVSCILDDLSPHGEKEDQWFSILDNRLSHPGNSRIKVAGTHQSRACFRGAWRGGFKSHSLQLTRDFLKIPFDVQGTDDLCPIRTENTRDTWWLSEQDLQESATSRCAMSPMSPRPVSCDSRQKRNLGTTSS